MIIVVTDQGGRVLFERWSKGYRYRDIFGEKLIATNNTGELLAVIVAGKMATPGSTIYTDSQLAFTILNRPKMRKLNPKPHIAELQGIGRQLITEKRLVLKWIPREGNLAGHYIENL